MGVALVSVPSLFRWLCAYRSGQGVPARSAVGPALTGGRMYGVSRDLDLPATELWVPDPPTRDQRIALSNRSAEAWTEGPETWTRNQVLRLALAAVLEAQLLHTRTERLTRFSLSSNPEVVTLEQLSALFRPHNGSYGQAFELAVADAVNAGVAEVVDPLREALSLIGVHEEGPLGLVVLGLEKVPPQGRAWFWDEVVANLGEGTVLRTGLRGRPASLHTVVRQLADATWRSMAAPAGVDEHGYRALVSQLGRADAMLYGSGWLTPVSFKYQWRHIGYPWRHVPIWVTQSGYRTRVQDRRPRGSGVPMVVVSLSSGGWVAIFQDAVETLYAAMRRIDLSSSNAGEYGLGSLTPMVGRLSKARGRTVADVCASLRMVDPLAIEMFNDQIRAHDTRTVAPTVNDDRFSDLWLRPEASSPLIVGQRHLFLPSGEGFRASEVRDEFPGRPVRRRVGLDATNSLG